MSEFKKWAALKLAPLLIVCLTLVLIPALRAQATAIKDLRIGNNEGYVRIVLEFDRRLTPPPAFSINHNRLQVSLAGIGNSLSVPGTAAQKDGIISLDVSRESGQTRIDAIFEFTPADVKTFALTGPHRFIIDAYRPLPSEAANPPIENGPELPSVQKGDVLPEPYSKPEKLASAALSTAIVEASLDAYDALASEGLEKDHSNGNRIQQRLMAALIVVTTVIVVLLFLLIWVGRGHNNKGQPSWLKHLPPTNDQNIESLDSVIRKHLKTYDQT